MGVPCHIPGQTRGIHDKKALILIPSDNRYGMSSLSKLEESYSRFAERDPNSPFGLMALELLLSEWQAYLSYNRDFDELTGLF